MSKKSIQSSASSAAGTSGTSKTKSEHPVSSSDSEDSSESDDEMFYDAIEASGTLISRYLSKDRSSRGDLTLVPGGDSIVEIINRASLEAATSDGKQVDATTRGTRTALDQVPVTKASPSPPSSGVDEATREEEAPSASARLQKFEETLKRLNNGGDEEVEDSPGAQSSSQASSVDGVYPQRQSRPFKVVEQDSVSLSTRIRPPDIISSCVNTTVPTEHSPSPTVIEQPLLPPVAPPRRRRRNKSPTISITSNIFLDKEAVGGSIGLGSIGVVTAQDEERTRSKTSGPRVLRRTESLGLVGSLEREAVKGLGKEQDAGGSVDIVDSPIGIATSSSQPLPPSTSGGGTGTADRKTFVFVRTKTDSGKMLSDLEILEQVTVRRNATHSFALSKAFFLKVIICSHCSGSGREFGYWRKDSTVVSRRQNPKVHQPTFSPYHETDFRVCE